MKKVKYESALRSAAKWVLAKRDESDRQRAEHAASRVRRYIECYDLLRSNLRWWTVVDIECALGLEGRLVRRTLEHLSAARVVELQRGGTIRGQFGTAATRARCKITAFPRRKKSG